MTSENFKFRNGNSGTKTGNLVEGAEAIPARVTRPGGKTANPKTKKLKAFSLAELVFVLGIIAILYMLVMPNQASTVAMAKSIEAKSMLNQVYSLERNYFFMYSKYSSSLEEIGFEQERLATEGGQANYRIEITEASASTFIANAVAVSDFDGDGEINVWQIDGDKVLKEITKD